MKKTIFIAAIVLLFSTVNVLAQTDSIPLQQNSADKLLASTSKLTIGGYAQIDYNQKYGNETRSNGVLDVHRMVMLLGYRFDDRTQFVTEIEYEHVSEVYIEQAFLQYKINSFLNFKAGLMLIPMGLINEYHEPTAYNGVERPLVDTYIAPTTWREIGAGFNGTLPSAGLKYQLYVVNGFNSYDGTAKLSGSNGLRKGRQKGAESFMSSPNFSGRVDYFGIRNLQLGASLYLGDTQSKLYDGLDESNDFLVAQADSSVVGVSMIGLDAQYKIGGLQLKGQYYYTELSNTSAYNAFTGKDVGSVLTGWYAEAAYAISICKDNEQAIVPFVRFENYNTHQAVSNNTVKKDEYNNNIITTGLGWKITKNSVLKADLQFVRSEAADEYTQSFNAGVGVMF